MKFTLNAFLSDEIDLDALTGGQLRIYYRNMLNDERVYNHRWETMTDEVYNKLTDIEIRDEDNMKKDLDYFINFLLSNYSEHFI